MYSLACGLCIWLSFSLCFAATAQESLLSRDDIRGGLQYIVANYERFIEKQIQISEIPAPPFKEQTRAEFMAGEFKRVGLQRARRIREPDQTQHFLGDFQALRLANLPVQMQGFADLVADRVQHGQRCHRLLKDDRDAPAANTPKYLPIWRESRNIGNFPVF